MGAKAVSPKGGPSTRTASAVDRLFLERASLAMLEAPVLARYRWVAPLVAGRRVLDAGCGVGRGAAILASGGAAEVMAVDETEAVVEVARSEAPPAVKTRRAELDHLPFQDAAFDVVLSLGPKQPAGTDVVAELLRAVKREGLLVISVDGDAVNRVRAQLSEQRRYVSVADRHELAGSQLRWEIEPGEPPPGRLIEEISISGEGGSAEPSPGGVLTASDAPIPPLDPVAVAFELGTMRQWLEYSKEQERRIRQLESRIGELQGKLDDRNHLRRELRTTEQTLAMRTAGYEEAVQQASIRTAERYRNTVSWKVTAPLRESKPKAKRLVGRLIRSAR